MLSRTSDLGPRTLNPGNRFVVQKLPQACDLLVIGGGIYGAWIAYDAALRGLRTVLIERDDWGSGTSSASSKLIHGGLRYLEYGDVRLVAKALRERARLRRLAPHAVRELRFLLPHARDARVPRLPLWAGLNLYDLLAGARPGIAPHGVLAREELLRRAPFLRRDDLISGWTYGDAAEDDARLVLELVDGAALAGAVVRARCPAIRLLRTQGNVCGALVRDTIVAQDHEIRAKMVVDATGAWAGALHGDRRLPVRHTQGIHLTLPPLPNPEAMLLQSPDRRVYFLIPYYGATLVGTTDTDYRGDPDRVRIEPGDVNYLLDAVAARCPGLGWTRADVRAGFAGLRTLRGLPGAPSAVTREWELLAPEPGLLVPLGGKYTSARVEAAITVGRIAQALGRKDHGSPTAQRRFPWAPGGNYSSWARAAAARAQAAGCDAAVAAALIQRHGRHIDTVLATLHTVPHGARRIHAQAPFCRAELAYAVQAEGAYTLLDVLRRRVPLMILVRPDANLLTDCVTVVGEAAGWNATRRAQERAAVQAAWWTPDQPALTR